MVLWSDRARVEWHRPWEIGTGEVKYPSRPDKIVVMVRLTWQSGLVVAAMLTAAYHYRYVFTEGTGHVDGGATAQTLAETMLWLWRGYPIDP